MKSADSSACWNQSSTYNIDESELQTSTRIELHCLITGKYVFGSPTSAPPERASSFLGLSLCAFFLMGGRGRDWLFAKPSLMQPFTKPPSLRLRIRCGGAFTTPKTPPSCSDWPLRSLQDDLDSIMHTSLASPLCSCTLFMTLYHVKRIRELLKS